MSALLQALALVGFLVVLVGSVWMAFDREQARWLIVSAVVLVAGIAVLIYQAEKEEQRGPCLREETQHVLSGNVLVPYTYCVERGEWVKTGE